MSTADEAGDGLLVESDDGRWCQKDDGESVGWGLRQVVGGTKSVMGKRNRVNEQAEGVEIGKRAACQKHVKYFNSHSFPVLPAGVQRKARACPCGRATVPVRLAPDPPNHTSLAP